jgi:hypothetical protein
MFDCQLKSRQLVISLEVEMPEEWVLKQWWVTLKNAVIQKQQKFYLKSAFQRFSIWQLRFSLIVEQQRPANHYFEQPRYYTFLAGHPEPSAPMPDDSDNRTNRSERDIFSQYLDDYVEIDLVDSDNERINLYKRARSPPPPPPPPQQQQNRHPIPKRQLLRRKLVLYEEFSRCSLRSSRSSSEESESNDSYEIGSFVEPDDEQLHEQSSYSNNDDEDDDEE